MDPYAVLGVKAGATDDEIRSAWLAGVREHPPDRDPEGFRRLREAYELLKDPYRRVSERLFGRPRFATLSDLAVALSGEKKWIGPGPWLRVIREKTP